ncbi:carbohydrate ABC transporter permease [Oceanotoga sp. DSM 15011]|jgi:putative chitobiose transport system permease protein|uniref:Carbohydrate ABC transporter membrane protein 2 (CUT1 family) n=1 Tax=Oceanotoga teriensis TaxID=515440 RepID=A0AA45HHV8_9BACT|nr:MULTISPECIES: carbohydrate ABC transporter permease [Oceanotoga]MDN5342888.1 putative chitobiose transport system permease protein [Oceanotoga sp.]MDO7976620.1 carbohydrate ABC transporter permease [Oceanotoga teriensis]PWJ87705.1 carbohydrate ABC transporter membrane protein 2 (CUT1 family) [Oceanotoga teriensis]UYO99337.1 carbohydrate ABC transporter permease [Oceanotoga sp. DSM 15011]
MQKNKKIKKMIFTYILLILLSLFFIFPFLWVLSTSFKGAEDIFGNGLNLIPKSFTIKNYVEVFTAIPMAKYFLNTLIITFIGVAFQVILASLAAYPLARLDFKGRNLIFYLILLPMLIPVEGSLVINFITILNLQLYNTYLSVVLPGAVSIFGIFLMRQHYLSVPKELEDAARIDGCNEFQVWWKITFPLVRPATSALAIFSFAAFWNSFLWPLIVLKDSNKFPLQVGLSQLNTQFNQNFRTISAAIVIATIPILVFFFFTQRYFIEGYKGAVKQ